MTDRADVIDQLFDSRQAASDSIDAHHRIIVQEVAKPLSDPAVLATCTQTIAQNERTIREIDDDIVAAILARSDLDDFLTTLSTTTETMKRQTDALSDDIDALGKAKTVASALAGVLSVLA